MLLSVVSNIVVPWHLAVKESMNGDASVGERLVIQ